MKNNLGNIKKIFLRFYILFITLFFASFLQAEDFEYHVEVDTKTPYVKEAVHLSFMINQTNKEVVLLFDFDLMQSDDYYFQRLDSQETDSYHNVQIRYDYIVYPLKSGTIPVQFKLLKKITTDESVAYSFSGDRDNIKGLRTKDTLVNLPALDLEVKLVPKGTQLVGDFTLDYKVNTHKANPYEPLLLQVDIEGLGYTPILEKIMFSNSKIKHFMEKPKVKNITSAQGIYSSVHYAMAFSSKESFTLPELKIQAFNPHKGKSYTLNLPSQYFEIKEAAWEHLLDAEDNPKPLKEEWVWAQTFLEYVGIFLLGYITALFWKLKAKRVVSDNLLKEKIKEAKDKKTLLRVLLASRDKGLLEVIEKLEASMYGNAKITLNKIKEEAVKQV